MRRFFLITGTDGCFAIDLGRGAVQTLRLLAIHREHTPKADVFYCREDTTYFGRVTWRQAESLAGAKPNAPGEPGAPDALLPEQSPGCESSLSEDDA